MNSKDLSKKALALCKSESYAALLAAKLKCPIGTLRKAQIVVQIALGVKEVFKEEDKQKDIPQIVIKGYSNEKKKLD